MSRPMKCSKLSEVGEQENMDKISSLPDDLLGQILSFLPTKCAVGTSILSSRWRCLHMLTNCLWFDAPADDHTTDIKAKKKSFERFVNRVLLFHKVSPIKKFHLDCDDHTFHASHLHAWISAAILRGVEQLHLFFPMSEQLNALPHSLFSCQTIVELKIDSSIQDFRVPESIHFPGLKILYLKGICFLDNDPLDKLLSACPLLQALEIVCCSWPIDSDRHIRLSLGELTRLAIINCVGRLEVDASNLAYLKFYFCFGMDVTLSLKNLDRLVTAHLQFCFPDDSDSIQHAVALIKAVYHVKELHLLGDVVEYLIHSEDDHMPSYPNLVELSLGRFTYDAWKYVTYWLANSPRLERLIFYQCLISTGSSRDEKWWPPNVPLSPFSSPVKEIEAFGFRGYSSELVLLKYLLENAYLLKRLILYKDSYLLTEKQELEACRELLMFPRASTTCVVQLMTQEQF